MPGKHDPMRLIQCFLFREHLWCVLELDEMFFGERKELTLPGNGEAIPSHLIQGPGRTVRFHLEPIYNVPK